jgi:two-component sensor histidine kinase
MALHELCTNAVKYGALSNEVGTVVVSWTIATAEGGERRLLLSWTEQGGPPVAPPQRRGFGSRMIERGLAAELGGTVELQFRPEGVCCLVDAPLPAAGEGLEG